MEGNMKTHHLKLKNKIKDNDLITTDLFSLIDAVAGEVDQEEEYLIPQAVLGILNHNKIKFLNKQDKKTNH